MIRVGILGTGRMGTVHAKHYRAMPDVEISFCDRKPDRAHQFLSQFEATQYPNPEKLIRSVDVVDLCLPTDAHLEYALMAIAEGKAVFVEKPIARTMEEAEQMIAAADQAGVPLMVGQVVRYFPEYERAHQLVSQGAVGNVGAVRLSRGGPRPSGSDDWFMDLERSGGALLDVAIHDFDWLLWTLGPVQTVYSKSVAYSGASDTDYALTTLTMASGAVAHVESTWLDPLGFRTELEVCGSAGMIEHRSRNAAFLMTSTSAGVRYESPIAPTDDPYYRELRAFLEVVQSGGAPPVDGRAGAHALQVSLAAIESAKSGVPIDLEA